MSTDLKLTDIEQLLAQADELIRQINSDAVQEMEEEHRLQFERHAQDLKRIKSEAQGRIEKEGASGKGSSTDGMHEAIQDIVKAMQALAKYLT